MPSLLVIEDESVLGRQIARALAAAGHEVRSADCAEDGMLAVREEAPDLVLLDLRLPDRSGLDVLSEIRDFDPGIPVLLMTAYGSVSDAVEAMRRGAADYLQKPLDLDELRMLVDRVLARQRRERELAYHRERGRTLPAGIVGKHPSLEQIFSTVERLREAGLAPDKRPAVLLTGETGTGKGVIARAIHEVLGSGPFIEVNCTAMPESLMEAELFGHERGTFTDAKTARAGLFEAAEDGTIFLDEIGHASLDLQAKLLKLIEEKRVRRLGSSRDRPVSVHVIAATNRDLDAAVEQGEFRRDLLHRLRVLSFQIPPLRDRGEDVPLIARHFCEELGRTYGREVRLSEEAERLLSAYPWPGNIRELRNVLERAILLEPGDELGAAAFSVLLGASAAAEAPAGTFRLPQAGIDLGEVEKNLIRQALERTGGNRTRAAALLGLTRDTLRYRLEKFGLD
jgi:DNA-binding NtrC family response regulator